VNPYAFTTIDNDVFLDQLKSDPRQAMLKRPRDVTVLDHALIGETETGFPLKADVFYKTRRPARPRPAIIFAHDSAQLKDPPRAGDRHGSYLALVHDYLFVSLYYRPPWEGQRAPCALKDMRTCARWLRSLAGEYAIMTDGIVAMGSSAGSQWAFLAASANGTGRHDYSGGYRDYSGDINLVILYGAICDFARDFRDSIGQVIVGATYEEAPETYRLYSPLDNVRPGLPPVFIEHGEQDTRCPLNSVLALRDALRAAHNDVELVVLPGVGHGGGPLIEKLERSQAFIHSRLVRPPGTRAPGARAGSPGTGST